MDERLRGRVSLVVLACAALALIATSPPSSSEATASGEVVVGPDRPASIDVDFAVSVPPSEADDLQLKGTIRAPGGPPETRFISASSVTVDGAPLALQGAEFTVPPAQCRSGCTVRVHTDWTWQGSPQLDVQVRWSASLFVNIPPYSNSSPIAVTPSSGEPAVPRMGWLLIGLAVGAATAIAWLRAGERYRRVRLGVALAGIVLPIALVGPQLIHVLFVFSTPLLGDWLRSVAQSVLQALVLAGIPIILFGVGVRRLLEGRPLLLGVSGWLYLAVFGLVAARWAEFALVYRPLEFAGLGALIATPAAAALTARGLVPNARTSHGHALLLASQAIVIGAFGAWLLPQVLGLFDRRSPARLSTETVVVSLLVVGLFAALLVGVRRWRNGRRGMLVLANALLLVPIAGLAAVAVSLQGIGRTNVGFEGLVWVAAVIVGFVGGIVVRPPEPESGPASGSLPADGERQDEGGQRDEVSRVHDEGDRLEAGERI